MTSEKETLEEAVKEIVEDKPKKTKVTLNSYLSIKSFLGDEKSKKNGKDINVIVNNDDSFSIISSGEEIVRFTRNNRMIIHAKKGKTFPNTYLPEGYSVSKEKDIWTLENPDGTTSEMSDNYIVVRI